MTDFLQPILQTIGVGSTLALTLAVGLLLGALIVSPIFLRRLRNLNQSHEEERTLAQYDHSQAITLIEEKTAALEEKSSSITEAMSAIEQLRQKADKAYYLILELRKENESLKTEQKHLESARRKGEEESVRLRNEQAQLQATHRALESNLEDRDASLKSAQDEITSQQEEISQLRRQKEAVQMLKGDFETGVRRLEEALQKSADERAALQNKNNRLLQEFEQVEKTRHEAEAVAQSVRDESMRQVNDNAALRQRLNEQAGRLDIYRQESVSQDEKYQSLLDESQLLSTQLRQKSVEVSRMMEELDCINLDKTALQEDLDQLNGHHGKVTRIEGRIWDRPPLAEVPSFRPLGDRSARIIALFNLKGGVGKTAITANLGATLWRQGFSTLLVDLDYQATLTERCLGTHSAKDLCGSIAQAFNGDGAPDLNCLIKRIVPEAEGFLFPATELLHESEDCRMAEWLMNPEKEDVRFRLRRLLHAPEVADRYDFILLDCPPRMTTAAVNALACADYLLIPTIPDKDSSLRVPDLLNYLRKLRTHLCPQLEILGVVGNMVKFHRGHPIRMHENNWIQLRNKLLDADGDPVHLFETFIPRFGALWQQHRFDIDHDAVRQPFVQLLDELLKRTPIDDRRLAQVVS